MAVARVAVTRVVSPRGLGESSSSLRHRSGLWHLKWFVTHITNPEMRKQWSWNLLCTNCGGEQFVAHPRRLFDIPWRIPNGFGAA